MGKSTGKQLAMAPLDHSLTLIGHRAAALDSASKRAASDQEASFEARELRFVSAGGHSKAFFRHGNFTVRYQDGDFAIDVSGEPVEE